MCGSLILPLGCAGSSLHLPEVGDLSSCQGLLLLRLWSPRAGDGLETNWGWLETNWDRLDTDWGWLETNWGWLDTNWGWPDTKWGWTLPGAEPLTAPESPSVHEPCSVLLLKSLGSSVRLWEVLE